MGLDFSAVSNDRWVGRLLRWPLQFIPRDLAIPIPQGRLMGVRWIVGSSNHGCWLGSYEFRKRRLFERSVKQGAVVFDVGAHVGFYTLLASRLVGSTGRVLAFEPVERNFRYLYRHLELNDVRNVTVLEGAVCERGGSARMKLGSNSSTGRLDGTGEVAVRAFSLDEIVYGDGFPPPQIMKMDIEGGEYAALRGAARVLAEARPLIFLSTHGNGVHAMCCRFLSDLGYNFTPEVGESLETCSELIAAPKTLIAAHRAPA